MGLKSFFVLIRIIILGLLMQACTPSESSTDKTIPTKDISVGSDNIETSVESIDTQTNGNWVVDYDSSRLGFAGTQTGTSFVGVFETFSTVIDFNPEDISNARIRVDVDMQSARTGDKQRDSSLPSKDWFHTKEYPNAIFISKSMIETGENTYEATGTLMIRDVTQDVTLPFTLVIDNDIAKAQGKLTLIRTTYHVGQGEWASGEWVGLDVEVNFDITASRSQ